MNQIGTLHRTKDNNGSTFQGNIQTLELDLAFWLKALPGFPATDDDPAYQVCSLNKSQSAVVIGQAWIRFDDDEDDPNEVPRHTIIMEIDDPSLPHALVMESRHKPENEPRPVVWHRSIQSPNAQGLR